MTQWAAAAFAAALLLPPAARADNLCPGDCDQNGQVTIQEIITGVDIVLGNQAASQCALFDPSNAGAITIHQLIAAVNAALLGCPAGSPPLLSSQPGDGSTDVPRTAWIRLQFAEPVAPSAPRSFQLACDGVAHRVAASPVTADLVVANPAGELAAGAHCTLTWLGPAGPTSLSFTTAPAGPPATVYYDRTDARGTTPFPDDIWLTSDSTTPTGVRLAVPVPDAPGDVRSIFRVLLQETNRLDGFSPIAHFVLELSDAPDPASLPLTPADSLDPLASIGLFDMTSGSAQFGQRVPIRLQIRTDSNSLGVISHSILIFPSIPLTPGGRYGLIVTRRALADPTRPLEPSAFFRAVMEPPTAGEAAAVTQARALAEDVLDVVAESATPPIPRDDVALAIRITVRTTDDIPRDLLAIKDQVLAGPPPVVTIESVDPDSRTDSDIAAIVHGTWDAPDWRQDLYLARDTDGLPMVTKSHAVPFILALPKAALDGPVPVTMYQHGNPGSAEAEVPGQARRSLAGAGFAVIGFTDNLNREVSPGVTDETEAITLQVLTVFGALIRNRRVPDYWVETNAEQIAFLRTIQGLGALDVLPIGAPDGIPDLEVAAPLTYVGISEGANHAPGLLPYAPELRAAALVVGGERLTEVLIHQQAQAFLDQLGPLFPNLTAADIWVDLALFQTIFDVQDPHNHARFIYRAPFSVAGTMQKASILLLEGLDDSMVPNSATDSLAWAMGPGCAPGNLECTLSTQGIPHLKPVQRAVPFLTTVETPVVANIDAHTSAAFYQYVPVGVAGIDPTPGCAQLDQHEGHFCAQSAAESLHQRVVFFQTALHDAAPTIIDPLAP